MTEIAISDVVKRNREVAINIAADLREKISPDCCESHLTLQQLKEILESYLKEVNLELVRYKNQVRAVS